jgi:hypothetical protein
MAAPCGWTVDSCGCGTCWDGYSPAVREQAAALATYVIWSATGRRYGPCEVTVLPCNPPPPAPLYRTYPVGWPGMAFGDADAVTSYPVLAGGQWFNTSCGGAGCACASRCEVALPGPVHSIIEISLSGSILDGAAYQVADLSKLVRLDGSCWPTCQTFGVMIPAFEVTYRRGTAIPVAVAFAARVLACQFAKLCSGGECSLPYQLRSLTRSGVSLEVEPPNTNPKLTGHITTGIAVVDQIIAADNPHHLTSRRDVVSPDDPAHRQITWEAAS